MQTDGSFSTTVQDSISTHSFSKITFIVLTAIFAFAGTLALYWESLKLPLFFDDMVHLRWLDWHSLSAVWMTAEGLGYYRPLTMSVWKVAYSLLGYHDSTLYHFINLFLHAINSALTGYIAWRVYRDKGRLVYALLAAMIFLTFPFSYQAVPSSSSLSKPLIATFTLASVALYWEARRRQQHLSATSGRWLLSASLLLAFLAPFAYETGVMLPLAILSVELFAYLRKEFDHFSFLSAFYMLLSWLIALPVVLFLGPKTGESLHLSSLLSLWQNGIYFFEGLLFPITPIGTPLEAMLQIDWYVLLAMINFLTMAALLLFYRWSKHLTLVLYALSWFIVGILPQWLVLDFAYVITSPRILYLGMVGSALIWAGVPVLLWVKLPTRWWPKIVALGIMIGMLGFNISYVRQKMDLAVGTSNALWQANQVVLQNDPPKDLLDLNVPAWVAPKAPTYRIGTEGLTFIPEYTRALDFVYVNTGVEHNIKAASYNPIKQDWSAHLGYVGEELAEEPLIEEIRRADAVYLTTYTPEALQFIAIGARADKDYEPTTEPLATFSDQIHLLKQQVEVTENDIMLDLWWYSNQKLEADLKLFAHIYDQNGQLVAQTDGYAIANLFPSRFWKKADLIRDIRYLTLPPDAVNHPYRVAIGWYDTSTGERLQVLDENGAAVADNALILLRR